MTPIEELRQKAADTALAARSAWEKEEAAAKAEKRKPTAEARAAFDTQMDEYDKLEKELNELEGDEKRSAKLAKLAQVKPPKTTLRTDPTIRTGTDPDEPEDRRADAIRNHPTSSKEYRGSFRNYLLGGPVPQLRDGLVADGAMASGGAAMAPMTMSARLLQKLDDELFMRQLATIERVDGANSLGIVSLDSDPEDGDWTTEIGTTDLDSAMAFGKRELKPEKVSKLVKVSNKLLRRSPFNIEALVGNRLAYKFGVTMERAYMTGNGQSKPLGIFTASDDGISTARDVDAAAAAALAADDFVNCAYNCKMQYYRRGAWVFSRNVVKELRLLKSGDAYIWQPAFADGNPATVLDRPYYISEYAPNTIAASQYVAVFGAFEFYTIADALAMEIQRLNETYALNDQTGFIGRMWSDGMPVLAEAFSRLKMAAA